MSSSRPSLVQTKVLPDALIVAIIIAWYFVAQDFPSFVLPGPLDVFGRWLDFFTKPELQLHILISLYRILISLVLAFAIGFLLAWCSHEAPVLAPFLDRRLGLVLNAFPSVGWAVVISIWFAASDFAVILIQILILVPFVFINCRAGFAKLDPELVELGQSLTRSRISLLVVFYLPMMRHYLMAAFQFALGLAFKIALVGELFGAESGVGVVMLRAQGVSDIATVLAGCLVFMVLYLAAASIADLVARRATAATHVQENSNP